MKPQLLLMFSALLLVSAILFSCKKEKKDKDSTPPPITINGDNPLHHPVGTPYNDPGAKAIYDIDGDISSNIVVTNNVNTGITGNYFVYYNVTDKAGNPAVEAVRKVQVIIP